ncbi:uncharacterized protein LACBIDRAFT_328485 [Laccaria bicolor S238N-H82]|uniref:Predicted protein n=1 Tax=Laccaria bicolor (strain S238N-H82 / ATCC MYA-4686) TaxID=486041 RepID=B0DEZ6_LACBS|nr:uncharacterized protein LACBIDRAFT_328485 [Laccaria bicolor S238N-H82]EDR06759.1 predicted protein [Laccaria bicolor S238N-H82]|eukprot:XP_001882606.1 predicted protein [Laccaria bicolor S238N-H82]
MATTSPTSSRPSPLVASASESEIASELLGEAPAPIQPGTSAEAALLAQSPQVMEAAASVATADDTNSALEPSKNECGASNIESGPQGIDPVASNDSLTVTSASAAVPDDANSTLEAINSGLRTSIVESGPEDMAGIDPAVGDASEPNYPPIIYAPVDDQNMETVQPGDGVKWDCPQTNMDYEMGDAENGEDEDDEDDDEDEEDEDEGSSEVSEGGDLIEELDDALSGDFNFKGNAYYSAKLPHAPNPCLSIEGLGMVGLPLSERDAKSIISCSAQAPFGHGERTVVDREVRDTWEIEPSNLKFLNPAWEPYIQNLAMTSVWQGLGVVPYSTLPKCELYKLLLYETGSQSRIMADDFFSFLPHQDTQKADGMFATLIIVLPSLYTGGEVHVTHASKTMVIDLSPNSLLSTCALAWYTDVKHEVKPVTSGYRLALSYNLIHTSPGVPIPSLPNMNSAVNEIRRVLHKWSKDAYEEPPMSTQIVAYLLKHQYSPANFASGAATLKGEDAHKVAHLRPVAEELGYVVCLANLKYTMTGSADDDYGYRSHGGWKRHRYYDDYDEDRGDPSMLEVDDESLTVMNVVDLNGNKLLGPHKLNLDKEWLVPKDPFEGLEPDDKEYEGYMGNGAGQLEYFYHRSVLLILHGEHATETFFSAGGVHYALQRLKMSTAVPPTQEDRKMANLILKSVKPNDKLTLTTIADYSLKWFDPTMWKAVVAASGYSLLTFGTEKCLQAWTAFYFETVRPSFEEMLKRSTRLQDRLQFINSLLAHAPENEKDAVQTWCEVQSTQALGSYDSALVEDIPMILTVAKAGGLSCVSDVILPNLIKKTSTYPFWVAFIKALHENRDDLPASRPAPAETAANGENETETRKQAVNKLIEQCLEAAIPQWEAVVSQPGYPYYGQSQPDTRKIDRIAELVELCILTSYMGPCAKLFVLVLRCKGDSTSKFQKIYIPLIPRLRELLVKTKSDICTSPFLDLMQLFIATYLRDMLGTKTRNNRSQLRKVGCGCEDCNSLDSFMLLDAAEHTFRLAQYRRSHLETRLTNARDLCTYVTVRSGTPHQLVVKKHKEIVEAARWAGRQKQARVFLASIGTDDTIAKIMGGRYADVRRALDGVQPFAVAAGSKAGPSGPSAGSSNAVAGPSATSTTVPATQTMSTANTLPGATSGTSSATAIQALAANVNIAGKKRKKTQNVQLGPVIDLTEGDSS